MPTTRRKNSTVENETFSSGPDMIKNFQKIKSGHDIIAIVTLIQYIHIEGNGGGIGRSFRISSSLGRGRIIEPHLLQ